MAIAHVVHSAPAARSSKADRPDVRIALLGVGSVGSAIAQLTVDRPAALGRNLRIEAGLVRDPGARPRPHGLPLTTDRATIFDSDPDVVVEVLGGIEPARTLVLDALSRRIPVVTANKSLLAHHADEIFAAAAEFGVPIRYEASVIAGVPFLGTLARRPLAASVVALEGIVNGTSNYILSGVAAGASDLATVLADAQRRGFAEPDPSKDVDGIDAAEKLVILVRQLIGRRVALREIETTGIRALTAADIAQARELGGAIKPVVSAQVSGAALSGFVGPAFVPSSHPLATLNGATNGLCLRDEAGTLLTFAGPGAGPAVTAVTVIDDVVEAVRGDVESVRPVQPAGIASPVSGWFVRLSSSATLPPDLEIADFLSAYGIWARRTSLRDTRDAGTSQWLLTHPVARQQIDDAAAALTRSNVCEASAIRALEVRS